MTNVMIVFNAAIAEGIYSEDEAVALMQRYGALPLFTFKVWKTLGKSVKKGEHARLVVSLWRKKDGKKIAEDEDLEAAEEEKTREYYLKTCYLFTADQVEPLKLKQTAR